MFSSIVRYVFRCFHKFKIIIGPLSLDKYTRLLPGTEGFNRLNEIIRLYVPPELAWEIELKIDPDSIGNMEQLRLGYTSYLCTEPPIEELEYLKLDIE